MRFLADFLRRPSLLCLLFMVLGGPSVVDSDRAVNFTATSAKCQFKSKGPSGPIYACKDPKTGKTQKVECQLSGNNNGDIHAQKMPKQLSGAELQKLCFEDR